MAKVVIITGAHNSGKTTYIQKVIGILSSKGYNIAYIKHDPKGKAITDTEGKDSWKIYNAGAKQVLVASPNKLSLFIREENYKLDKIVNILSSFNPDLIIVEGFKSEKNYDKFEVIREEENRELMCLGDENLKGVITDYYQFSVKFDINNPEVFCQFLEKKYIRGQSMVVHMIFYGKVHGVGFRKFVKSKADQLGVIGYVKNLPDGTVEVVAKGNESTLERFIDEIKDGPERAKVEMFNIKEISLEVDWDEFEIRY